MFSPVRQKTRSPAALTRAPARNFGRINTMHWAPRDPPPDSRDRDLHLQSPMEKSYVLAYAGFSHVSTPPPANCFGAKMILTGRILVSSYLPPRWWSMASAWRNLAGEIKVESSPTNLP